MFHDSNIVLERFAQGIIRRKVRLLVGRAGFTQQDRPDLEQELVLRLFQSVDRFDPKQAHPNVFITTVVERSVAMMLRERRAKKRDGGIITSLDGCRTDDDCSTEPPDPRCNGNEASDLVNDLADVLAHLPEKLRDLAERLKHQSLSEAARELRMPRSTLQRYVHRLRRCFEDAGLKIYL